MVSRLKAEVPLLTAAITRRRVWHVSRASQRPLLLYGLVAAAVATAALLTAALWATLDPQPGILFVAAIVVSAWVGGLGPGLAATALSAVALELVFMRPFYGIEPVHQHALRLGLFALVGIFITLLYVAGRLGEDAIVRSEEFLQSTLDALGAPIAIIDRHGVVVAENAAWHRFFRAGAPPRIGGVATPYLDVWTSGADARSVIAQGLEEVFGGIRREFWGEFSHTVGGQQHWVAVRVTRFEDQGGARAVVVHEDITERRNAEEAERRAETLRSVARLASAAAHEINNPLAIIMGNVEIIAQNIDPSVSDRIRPTLDAIERIRRIVQGMTGITNLEFSQQSPSLPEMLDLHRSGAGAEEGDLGNSR